MSSSAHMDAANIDLKGFTEEFYHRTSARGSGAVLETLRIPQNETNVWFEITTLLIPGNNDSEEEIAAQSDGSMISARTYRCTSRPFIRTGN